MLSFLLFEIIIFQTVVRRTLSFLFLDDADSKAYEKLSTVCAKSDRETRKIAVIKS